MARQYISFDTRTHARTHKRRIKSSGNNLQWFHVHGGLGRIFKLRLNATHRPVLYIIYIRPSI